MVKKSILKFNNFGHLSFTTARGKKIGFNSYECIQFLNNVNFHAFHVWENAY